jgi:exonuclease III
VVQRLSPVIFVQKTKHVVKVGAKKFTVAAWNCNMAFRMKAKHILKDQPDILIISECEHPEKFIYDRHFPTPSDICWYGTNKHKGIAVLSYSGFKLKMREEHNPAFRLIVPVSVSNEETSFLLFAVWANNPADKKYAYIGQVWKALHYYTELLAQDKIMLAGDFNSNTFWDKPKREWNHSNVVAHFEEKNIYSTYHTFYNQKQGKEKHSTQFMYRHKNKPYHLDYCFASSWFINKMSDVKVGTYRRWAKYSDHMPLFVSFNL